MRPAKVSREIAERLMAEARARGEHPKPIPVLKPRKPMKRGGPIARGKPPAAMSARTRRRVTGWAAFRDSIRARDVAICGWCGLPEDRRGATAEHAFPRVHSREDKETNCYWIGSWACHRAKEEAGVRGQVKVLWQLSDKYQAIIPGVDVAEGGTKPFLVVERNLLVLALRRVQSEIDAGRRPSLLWSES